MIRAQTQESCINCCGSKRLGQARVGEEEVRPPKKGFAGREHGVGVNGRTRGRRFTQGFDIGPTQFWGQGAGADSRDAPSR